MMNNLKVNVLLDMNFLVSEKAVIDLSKQRIVFDSCANVSVSCHVTARDNVNVRRDVRANKKQIVAAHTTIKITVSIKKKSSLLERDFIFESELKDVYAHFVDFSMNFINVRNDKDKSMMIFKN